MAMTAAMAAATNTMAYSCTLPVRKLATPESTGRRALEIRVWGKITSPAMPARNCWKWIGQTASTKRQLSHALPSMIAQATANFTKNSTPSLPRVMTEP